MTSSRPESEGDQRNNHSSETRTDTDPKQQGLDRFPLWGWHHAWFSVKNDPSGGPAVATVLTIGTSIPVILNPCCKDKLHSGELLEHHKATNSKLLLLQIYNQSDKIRWYQMSCNIWTVRYRLLLQWHHSRMAVVSLGFVLTTSILTCELYYNNTGLASSPSLIILQVPRVKCDEFTAQTVLRERASRTLQGCG